MRKIALPDEGAESLFGTYDENLKHLESLFNVRIRTSGHELIVEGDAGRRRARRARARPAGGADARRLQARRKATCDGGAARRPGRQRRAAGLLPARRRATVRQAAGRRRRASTSAAISTPSSSTTSSSASARPAPARPTWPWRRPSRSCSPSGSAASSWRGRRSKRARSSASCPGDLQEKVNPYLRPLYDALYDMLERRARRAAARARHDRSRADRVHARPHAERRVRHPRRGAEHHLRADEDVPDPPRLRIEGGRHRRHHADRSADRAARPAWSRR